MPNDGDLADMLLDWVPDEAQRKKMLVDNPQRLYGFRQLEYEEVSMDRGEDGLPGQSLLWRVNLCSTTVSDANRSLDGRVLNMVEAERRQLCGPIAENCENCWLASKFS